VSSLSMLNGSSKTYYFIDFWYPFFWRLWRPSHLKDKDQMSRPNERTDNFKSNLTCTLKKHFALGHCVLSK
jgi:hypothetical protein